MESSEGTAQNSQSTPITRVTQGKVTDSLPSITRASIKCQQCQCYWKDCKNVCKIRQTQTNGLEHQIRSCLDTQIKFQHLIDLQSWAEEDIKQGPCQIKRETIITSLHLLSNEEGHVMTAQMWNRKWGLDKSNSLRLDLHVEPFYLQVCCIKGNN